VLNVRNDRGSTPLHEAVHEGFNEAVALMLKHHAPANEVDSFGNTPLHVACLFGNREAAKLLVAHGAEIDYTSEGRSWTPLMLALNESYIDMATWLINQGANLNHVDRQQGWTPLLVACDQGLSDMTLQLIEKGSQVDAKLTGGDAKGRSAIHLLAYNGEVEAIRVLLDQGIDVNLMPEGGGLSALHWAVYNNHVGLMQFLVERGANVNIRAGGIYQDRGPLHYTVSCMHPDMAAYLLRYGADPLLKDREGKTPVQMALERFRESASARNRKLLDLMESYI
jgi:ankyrin repeat protein